MVTAAQNLSDIITAVHPIHADYAKTWLMYLTCYEGGRSIREFLKKHEREDNVSYTRRRDRSYYYNYCAMVIDMMSAFLYRADIKRDPKWEGGVPQDVIDGIYNDADQDGNSLNQFMWSVDRYVRVFGYMGILVDMPRGEVRNELERRQQGIRPYLTEIDPVAMRAWSFDEKGSLRWIRYVEDLGDEWDAMQKRSPDQTVYYRTWTRDMWYLHKVVFRRESIRTSAGRTPTKDEFAMKPRSAEEVGRGPNPLGEVPVVLVRHVKSKRTNAPWGLSYIRDIARINLGIMAWSSLIDEEAYNRCLNILTMPRQPGGDSDEIKLSHYNILEYDPQAVHPPAYLTAPGEPMAALEEHIGRAVDQIYRIAGLGGLAGYERVRQVQSGIAWSYEFNETNQMLASDANDLEDAEKKVHRLIGMWMSSNGRDKKFTGEIDYPEQFGVENLLDDLALLQEFKEGMRSDTAKREMEKKVAMKFLSKSPDDIRAKVEHEIDTEEDVPPQTGFGFGGGFGG